MSILNSLGHTVAAHKKMSAVIALVAVAGLWNGASSGAGSGGSGGYDFNRHLRQQVFNSSNDSYFDGCQWSQGCGGDTNAWNGNDGNSISGGSSLDPLNP
jgi:hypothetical protein